MKRVARWRTMFDEVKRSIASGCVTDYEALREVWLMWTSEHPGYCERHDKTARTE